MASGTADIAKHVNLCDYASLKGGWKTSVRVGHSPMTFQISGYFSAILTAKHVRLVIKWVSDPVFVGDI